MAADRPEIGADGKDLGYVTVRIIDGEGLTCPRAMNVIRFEVEGPGEIVATDNGDPTNFVPFSVHEREAFNGLALVIVRGIPGKVGAIKLTAESDSLKPETITIRSVR